MGRKSKNLLFEAGICLLPKSWEHNTLLAAGVVKLPCTYTVSRRIIKRKNRDNMKSVMKMDPDFIAAVRCECGASAALGAIRRKSNRGWNFSKQVRAYLIPINKPDLPAPLVWLPPWPLTYPSPSGDVHDEHCPSIWESAFALQARCGGWSKLLRALDIPILAVILNQGWKMSRENVITFFRSTISCTNFRP